MRLGRRSARPANASAPFCAALALLSAVATVPGLAAPAERWQLTISGHQRFVYGEPDLGGGLRVPWEVRIDFYVVDGEYQAGSGRARWIDQLQPISVPPGWFACRQVDGTYLDSNLNIHQTPRVRFAAFPVAGRLSAGRVELVPGYVSPGNYLAVTYECVNENRLVDNWFAFAERGKQVLGKRQDVETRREPNRLTARVREVAPLPPESRLELPLSDGWTFEQGGSDSERHARYELHRVE